ncbi:MAG: hypothetical protein QOF52_2785 [Propionibacteriaceae bacterium]|jgi:uncharacterized protein (DUF2267 family)|nr:hypothetical protein [Propionibacteriaceae bacterium]MDX6322927.1 hypothetical protein [Propionibacteriaceae bacterium]
MKSDEFTEQVAGRADVGFDKARALTEATLQTLAERISGGEALDLAAQLPEELKAALTSAPETAERFGVNEFVRRVAERAGVDEDTARKGVAAVMTTIRQAVTSGEFDDITSQLPQEFNTLVGAA